MKIGEVDNMFYARIRHEELLAEYRFGSSSFKWVYEASIKFARTQLFLHPEISCLIIHLEDDILVAVSRTGITIDMPGGVYEIDKVNLWKDTDAYC